MKNNCPKICISTLFTVVFLFMLILASNKSYAGKDYSWDGGAASDDWQIAANWNNFNTGPGNGNDPGSYQINGNNYNAEISTTTFPPGNGNTNTYGINELGIRGSATLTIFGDILTVTSGNGVVAAREGGTLIINGGDLVANNLSVLDANSTITITNGTVTISGTVAIGADPADPAGANTGGSPTIIVGQNGILECNEIIFDDEEGDTPKLIIQGNGIVNVATNVTTTDGGNDGTPTIEGVGNISISGTGQLNILGNLEFDNKGVSSDIFTMTGGTVSIGGNWTNAGANIIDGGTITFNGAGAQDITSTTSASGASLYNVVIENTTGISMSRDISITGNLTSTAALSLPLTVTFNGSSQQTVSSTGGITFNNFVLNNPAGIVLSNATTIAANADFQSGLVTLGSTLTFLDGATSTSTSTSYVNGAVIKIGGNDFTFPLSSQIGISGLTGTETFTAQYSGANGIPVYGSNRADGISHVSSLEHWVLNRDAVLPNESASVTLHWNAGSDVGPDAAAWSNLLVCRWDGSEWVSHGGGGSGTASSGTVTSGSVSNFSPFTFGSSDTSNPLPVEFLYFEASIYNDIVELDWATATETDNDKFEIERSIDGVRFNKIGEVSGKGDSNKRINYAFDDNTFLSVYSEDVYYRLKQIDYDGQYEYSEIARVYKPLEKKTLEIVPNPYSSSFDLQFVAGQAEQVTVRVLDMNGKIYYSERFEAPQGPNSIKITDLYNIPVGLYLVNIQGASTSFTERILKRDN